MTLTIGSLFAGYGGLDLGIEAALDARTAWVSEIDPGACKVLATRFPHAPNLGDVTTIDWGTVPRVDIIAGGSPCQDLSTAGRRAGMTEGTRSNLWVAMREAIAHIQPTYVIWENVRGAYSATADSDLEPCAGCVGDGSGGGIAPLRALGRVLGDLSDLGFDAEWRGLRASDVGACHQRFRIFVLAWRRDAADADDAGLQGSHDPQGAAQAGLHGHPVAGAGRSGLTLLPTPRGTDGTKGGPNQRGSKGDLMLPSAVHQLLPTPVVTDAKGARNATSGRKEGSQHHSGTTLTDALVRTNQKGSHHADTSDSVPRQDLRDMREDVQPEAVQRTTGGPGALSVQAQLFAVVREHEERGDEGRPALACQETQGDELRELRYGGSSARPSHRPEPSEQRPREPDDALRLMPPEAALAGGSSEAAGVQSVGCGCPEWGHYAPAIHQHELASGRIAPPPTEVGPSGKPRLSARAVEWMMGLPAGWVTDIDDVSRASQLQMLGNGVVPQQAAAALRIMLSRASQEVAV